MTITVEELRRKYPEPVVSPEDNGGYCVGYAFGRECDATGIKASSYIDALIVVNPTLTSEEAHHIWLNIVRENDAGNFDVAWAWLDKGLNT